MPFILGIDSSTQSISGIILDTKSGDITHEASINFESDLPQYECASGYITNEKDEYFASPLMWLDGLELLLSTLKSQGAPFQQIAAIAGTAQQHATVYLNGQFTQALSSLNPQSSLSKQIQPTLSRELSPIWMDNTTTRECQEITQELGEDYLISTSGSVATPRFSGAQIRKFFKHHPQAYHETQHIHMCSSWMASVLTGTSAGLDHTDASGMNLLNLTTLGWDHQLLEATAPSLSSKLPVLCPTRTILGKIAPYFVEKHGISPHAQVTAWSGDNPASLVGMGAYKPGRIVLSLGTSYTLFAAMDQPHTDPNGYGHVFCNPMGGYMALSCFKNGALTNEHLRQHFNISWEEFDHYASFPRQTRSASINPFLLDEITPPTPANPEIKSPNNHTPDLIGDVLDATFLNIKESCQWINLASDTIHVTGGASRSAGICQTIANIFDKKVQLLDSPGSASLGAAMIAASTIPSESFDLLETKIAQEAGSIFHPSKEAHPV